MFQIYAQNAAVFYHSKIIYKMALILSVINKKQTEKCLTHILTKFIVLNGPSVSEIVHTLCVGDARFSEAQQNTVLNQHCEIKWQAMIGNKL